MLARARVALENRELTALEPLVYGLGLALFGFVVASAARMPPDMILIACIPPVFVALVMGFVMAIYAGETYGVAMPALAIAAGALAAWFLPPRYTSRDRLIAIYLAWVVGMVFTLFAVQMPDVAG